MNSQRDKIIILKLRSHRNVALFCFVQTHYIVLDNVKPAIKCFEKRTSKEIKRIQKYKHILEYKENI